MKCPKLNNVWCSYYFSNRCNKEEFNHAWESDDGSCPGAVLSPSNIWINKMLEMMTPNEIKSQLDVCELVFEHAKPNNPLDPFDVCECDGVKEWVKMFLDQYKTWVSIKDESWYNHINEDEMEGEYWKGRMRDEQKRGD